MMKSDNISVNDELSLEATLWKQFGAELAVDLDYLALLHDAEMTPSTLQKLSEFKFSESLALVIVDQNFIDTCRALDDKAFRLFNVKDKSELDSLAVDYAGIYLNYTYRASPVESVWMDDESLTYQDAMFDIRKIYENHGLKVQDWRTRSDDHLVCQIEFIARMLRDENLNSEKLASIAQFYDEHLFRWLNSFSETVCTRSKSEFYRLAARLTEAYLDELRNCIATIIEVERPTQEEVEAKLAGRSLEPDTYELKFVPGHSESW